MKVKKSTYALLLVNTGLLAFITIPPTANAVIPEVAQIPSRIAKAATTCGTCVAPITSAQEDSLVFDYVGASQCGCANGYWRARQSGGSIWVRLTLVGGN